MVGAHVQLANSVTHYGPSNCCGGSPSQPVILKLWVLRGSASLVGEEHWAIKLSQLRLSERVHLLIEAVACGEETL